MEHNGNSIVGQYRDCINKVIAMDAETVTSGDDIDLNTNWNVTLLDNKIRTIEQVAKILMDLAGDGGVLDGIDARIRDITERLDNWEPFCLRTRVHARDTDTEWFMDKLSDNNLGWNFLYFMGTGGNYLANFSDNRNFTGDLYPIEQGDFTEYTRLKATCDIQPPSLVGFERFQFNKI